MSNGRDLFQRFDHWMKTYRHEEDSDTNSIVQFIFFDSAIIELDTTYDDYVQLVDAARTHGYEIDFVISEATFDRLKRQAEHDRYSRRLSEFVLDDDRHGVMLDPSLLLHGPLANVLLSDQALEAPRQLFAPATFVRSLSADGVLDSLVAFYGVKMLSHGAQAVLKFVDSGVVQPFEVDRVVDLSTQGQQHDGAEDNPLSGREALQRVVLRRESLLRMREEWSQRFGDTVGGILLEEWVFLHSQSWLASRSRKVFDGFIEAGGVALQTGRRLRERILRRVIERTLPNVPPAERNNPKNAVRALAKWLAVGLPSSFYTLDSMPAGLLSTAAGFFLLLDD